LLLDAELVAGLLTRTELMMLLRWGNSRQDPFSPRHFWAIKSMEYQGIHFNAGDILPSFVFVALLNPMVKKNEILNLLPHFWML
jgi:hypothetical protein